MGNPERATPLSAKLGGESDRGVSLEQHWKRLRRFQEAKQRALAMVSHIRSLGQLPQLAPSTVPSLEECGDYLRFQYYHQRDIARLAGANFCKIHLLCPLCAIRRGARSLRIYLEKWEQIRQENPNLVLWFVTFTVRNGFDLGERFDHLNQSITKLINNRNKNKHRNTIPTEFAKVEGGIGSFETTFSDTHGWHPHVHFIMALEKENEINPEKLSAEWRRMTGDSFIVDARPVYGEPVEAFVEICKYALKFSDMRAEQNFEAFLTLRSRRMFRSFGCFYGVKIPEDLNDEEMDLDEPYTEFIYRYFHSIGYQCVEQRECTHEKPFAEIQTEYSEST